MEQQRRQQLRAEAAEQQGGVPPPAGTHRCPPCRPPPACSPTTACTAASLRLACCRRAARCCSRCHCRCALLPLAAARGSLPAAAAPTARRPRADVPRPLPALQWFARLWEIDVDDFWGYITNCGTGAPPALAAAGQCGLAAAVAPPVLPAPPRSAPPLPRSNAPSLPITHPPPQRATCTASWWAARRCPTASCTPRARPTTACSRRRACTAWTPSRHAAQGLQGGAGGLGCGCGCGRWPVAAAGCTAAAARCLPPLTVARCPAAPP